MQGTLELRAPGIIGKWEERYFTLDADALRYAGQGDGVVLGEFPVHQIENVVLDASNATSAAPNAQEVRFSIQGKQWRLRTREEDAARTWFSSLQFFIEQAKVFSAKPDFSPGGDLHATASPKVSPRAAPGTSPRGPRQTLPSQTSSPAFSTAGSSPGGRARITSLHESHKRKMEKLQKKREEEAEAEKKRWQDSIAQIKSKTLSPKTKVNSKDVAKTADRLFNEHKFIQQRLAEKKAQWEMEEIGKIYQNRRVNLPTRTNSDPCLLTSREAGDRLYSDAERRELWRQQARDAQAKEELMLVSVGTRGSPVQSISRCHDLHADAKEKQQKLEKERKALEEQEIKKIQTGAVKVSKKYNPKHTEMMYEQHKVKQQRLNSRRDKEKEEEITKMEEEMVRPRKDKDIRKEGVPWKDPDYPYNLPNNKTKKSPEKPVEKKPIRTVSHADLHLTAIQATIALRSGYSKYSVRPAQKLKMLEELKKVMRHQESALHHVNQDPGFANLCSRSSLKLFQAHLLPEVEGWAHRLEPDPIRQVEDDLDNLLNIAAKAQEALKEEIAPGGQWKSGGMRSNPSGIPTALWAYDPGVKPKTSAETKALVRYGPGEGAQRYRHLLDLSRLQICFASCDMLQAGLEQVLKNFEVVDVRNYFGNPGRLGSRYVEVLVVMIVRDGTYQVPHVCELRLEPLICCNARKAAMASMQSFMGILRDVYAAARIDLDAVEYIARSVLERHPEGHRLRTFRCNLSRRFGSTVCSWRRAFGGSRLVNFQRFREVCYSLHYGEHVTELWQELDPGRGGCISLWELDPDAVALLTKLRARMLASLSKNGNDDLEGNEILQKIAAHIRPVQQGRLERHEFRTAVRTLGLSVDEADRAFACLDHFPISTHESGSATVDGSDIAWLKKFPNLVDPDAVACAQDPKMAAELSQSLHSTGEDELGVARRASRSVRGSMVKAWESPRLLENEAAKQEASTSGTKPAPPAPEQKSPSYKEMRAAKASQQSAADKRTSLKNETKAPSLMDSPVSMGDVDTPFDDGDDYDADGDVTPDDDDDYEELAEEGGEEEFLEEDEEEDAPEGEETW